MRSTKDKLRQIVFENLMRLPAYKLEDTQQKVYREYELADLNRLIKNKKLIKSDIESEQYNIITKKLVFKRQKYNQFEIFLLAFKLWNNRYKQVAKTIISFILSFLVRVDNLFLIIIGLICYLFFLFSFLTIMIKFGEWYSYVESTFSLINRNLNKIEDYINSFESINEINLQTKAQIITENIVTTEISGLTYDMRRLEIFHILFAFFLSWLFVYIVGDIPSDQIRWIATNILKLGDFEIFKSLNTETFVFLILIPIGIPFSKYIIISGLKERNKRLQQSLAIIKNSIVADTVNIEL